MFLQNFNKIGKFLAKLKGKKGEGHKQIRIRNNYVGNTIDLLEVKRIVRIYDIQLCMNKLDNLDVMDTFLETHNYQNGLKRK